VRHVRILGVCVAAVSALSALAASPALATKFSTNTWTQFKSCPYTDTQATACYFGMTTGGTSGGYFQLGRVLVPLAKPVIIQGALLEEEEVLGHESGGHKVVAAANGGETLESPELKVTGGLALITKQIQENSGWPQSLKESLKAAEKNKEGQLYAKIEVAGGNKLYENPNALNTNHLLGAEGNAFELPLKVRLISPWLTKLGGGVCTVGSETEPIMQDLTSGGAGAVGTLHFSSEFTMVEIEGSRLVDFNWPVASSQGASGCGGEYESAVDSAINETLELPKDGLTVLQGTLFTANRKAVRSELEFGNEEHIEEVE
jgi:hypothetical protein